MNFNSRTQQCIINTVVSFLSNKLEIISPPSMYKI